MPEVVGEEADLDVRRGEGRLLEVVAELGNAFARQQAVKIVGLVGRADEQPPATVLGGVRPLAQGRR